MWLCTTALCWIEVKLFICVKSSMLLPVTRDSPLVQWVGGCAFGVGGLSSIPTDAVKFHVAVDSLQCHYTSLKVLAQP